MMIKELLSIHMHTSISHENKVIEKIGLLHN